MDRDPTVRPHVVGDFTALPFADGSFSEVWADPPHQARPSLKSWTGGKQHRGHGLACYGAWRTLEEYRSALRALRLEALRVLAPGGALYLKLLVRDDPPEPRGRVPSSAWVEETLPGMETVRRAPSRLPWSRCEVVLLRCTTPPASRP